MPGALTEAFALCRRESPTCRPIDHMALCRGKSAFAHKGGIHVAAMLQDERATNILNRRWSVTAARTWSPSSPGGAMCSVKHKNLEWR